MKLIEGEPFTRILVPDYGQIGAGTILKFTPRGERWIIQPLSSHMDETLFAMTVSGTSLKGDEIFDGDVLVCTRKLDGRQIASGALCIVELPDKEMTVKHVFFEPEGYIRLVSSNPAFEDRYFEPELVTILAVVTSSFREY